MKILIIASDLPYGPEVGHSIFLTNTINALKANNEIDLLVMNNLEYKKDINIPKGVNVLKVFDKVSAKQKKLNKLKAMLTFNPPTSATLYCKDFDKALMMSLAKKEYDAVISNVIDMQPYCKTVKKCGYKDKHIFTVADSLTLSAKRAMQNEKKLLKKLYYFLSYKLVKRFEKNYHKYYKSVVLVSQIDIDYIKALNSKTKCELIPINVSDSALDNNANDNFDSIFCGLRYTDNAMVDNFISFVKNDYLKLVTKFPSLTVEVLGGSEPPQYLVDACKNYNIKLYGKVDNYFEIVCKSKIAVFTDIIGTGMKNRVLSSLATGQAVVATENALEGFDYKTTNAAICAETGDMHTYIEQLLSDINLAKSYGDNAKKLVQDNYSESTVNKKWEDLVKND